MADNYEQYSREELLRLLRERDRKPKFGLVWERDEIEHDKSLNDDFVALDLDPALSCGDAPFENLIIEGDNFDALRYLRMTHAGRVKCIYIDPPYNTGNRDFIYNDRFVDKDDAYRHSKWLEFMYRRLVLAKDLLTEDGVIFVSIDDNEMLHLGMLMDQVFGEKNCLAKLIWQTDGNFDNQARYKICHEYVLVYAATESRVEAPPVIDPNAEETGKLFRDEIRNTIVKNGPKNPVSDIVLRAGFPADFEEGVISARSDKWPHFLSDAVIKEWALVRDVTLRSGWANKKLCERFIATGFSPVWDTKNQLTSFILTETGALENVKVRTEEQSHVISVIKNVGSVQASGTELVAQGIGFTYPKPVGLIEYLISMVQGEDALVLDFFAGSGTTAHAVMKLNAQDGGKRRFILVSSTEAEIPPNPPFSKGGSKAEGDSATGDLDNAADEVPHFEKGGRRGDLKNLCRDVCAERVRRVMQGYTNKKGEAVEGLGGSPSTGLRTGFAYLRTKRIPVSRVFNDIQHEQVWRALQLIHGVPLAGYETDAPVQVAGNTDDRLLYVPKLSEAVLEEVARVAGLGGRLVVYSWQPGQIRQRVEASNVDFERIPEFLVSRFGGGK